MKISGKNKKCASFKLNTDFSHSRRLILLIKVFVQIIVQNQSIKSLKNISDFQIALA
jgi:hypothetical protein